MLTCCFSCTFRSVFVMKPLPQYVHMFDLTASWYLMCWSKLDELTKRLLHLLQAKGRTCLISISCSSTQCRTNKVLDRYLFEQCSHWKDTFTRLLFGTDVSVFASSSLSTSLRSSSLLSSSLSLSSSLCSASSLTTAIEIQPKLVKFKHTKIENVFHPVKSKS